MRQIIPLILASFLIFQACGSGKKALKHGDYREAVTKAIKRLKSSPNNSKARATLADAYPRFVTYYMDKINLAKKSSDAFRWEQVVNHYEALNFAYDEIQRSPAAQSVIANPQSFHSDYESALTRAAEVRYTYGEQALVKGQRGDREAAKRAYDHFQKADDFKVGFRDSYNKMAEALELATVFVLIEPIPVHSRSLNLVNEFFQNQIIEYSRANNPSRFVKYITLEDYREGGQEPDQIIRMIFDDFVVGQSYIKENVEDRSKDSVVVGQIDVDVNGKMVKKDVYNTVTAKVHIFRKEISSRGLLDLRVLDARTQAVISQKKFPGTFVWFDTWGYYNGDERALTSDDRNRIRNKREVPPPAPQDLFIGFTKPIYTQATRFLKNFYRGY